MQATRDLKEDTFDSRSAPADVRNAIDQALRESGDLGVYGDLSRGLAELEKEFQVTIHQSANAWHLSLGPISGAGHDFSLTIIAATGEVVDVVIGEVVPPRRVPDGR
ncbi:MAG: hypothetical protein JW797_09700 [Bradymonadales bacterium]|nr:hypothetical protein [Bradymonadales bacterium]